MSITADVQLENGFTRVANSILDNIVTLPLNGTQFRVVMLIWRETYGFTRKECSLSETYIASRLGLKRQNVHREIKGLFESGILTVIHEATFNSSRVIAFNKNYDKWQNGLHEAKVITGIENDSSPVIILDSSTGIESDSHRKKPINKPLKKPIAHSDYESRFLKFWTAYPKKKSKGDAEKAWKALKLNDNLTEIILKSIEIEKSSKEWLKDGGQYIPYPATWLRAKGWEDEISQPILQQKSDGWGGIPEL